VAEADAVIFVVDVRAGLSAQDHDIARFLRTQQEARGAGCQQGRRHDRVAAAGEFHELGIGEPHPVSAAHGQGIRSLLERVADFATRTTKRREPADGRPIRLAVAGRPNVGKSR
jgi:GTP-binding protein